MVAVVVAVAMQCLDSVREIEARDLEEDSVVMQEGAHQQLVVVVVAAVVVAEAEALEVPQQAAVVVVVVVVVSPLRQVRDSIAAGEETCALVLAWQQRYRE
jgi:hypothetical protein